MQKMKPVVMALVLLLILSLGGCGTTKPQTSDTDKPEKATESTEAVTEGSEEVAESTEEITESSEETSESTERVTESTEEVTVDMGDTLEKDAFYISPITDDIFERIKGKSFKDDCTLPRKDLRYLHVLHKDLDGIEHEGEMIVNKHIAEDVLDILKELYEADYPIEKIRLIDEYNADDEASMEDNNSSAFNFRFISHSTNISKHGLGLAVDINPLYNPYIKYVNGERVLEPITAEAYLDRDADFPYKIDENDLCYKLFTKKGFKWGGSCWTNRKDYQHFEISSEQISEWYPNN